MSNNHPNRSLTVFDRAVRLVDAAERTHTRAVRDLRAAERADAAISQKFETAGCVNRDYEDDAAAAAQALSAAATLARAAAVTLAAAREVLRLARA